MLLGAVFNTGELDDTNVGHFSQYWLTICVSYFLRVVSGATVGVHLIGTCEWQVMILVYRETAGMGKSVPLLSVPPFHSNNWLCI